MRVSQRSVDRQRFYQGACVWGLYPLSVRKRATYIFSEKRKSTLIAWVGGGIQTII